MGNNYGRTHKLKSRVQLGRYARKKKKKIIKPTQNLSDSKFSLEIFEQNGNGLIKKAF